jgi:hypothetical protein
MPPPLLALAFCMAWLLLYSIGSMQSLCHSFLSLILLASSFLGVKVESFCFIHQESSFSFHRAVLVRINHQSNFFLIVFEDFFVVAVLVRVEVHTLELY